MRQVLPRTWAALLVVAAVVGAAPAARAATYYVNAAATGSGDGSAANPWTIYQAAGSAVAGDTVLLAKGTYTIATRLTFANAGTVGTHFEPQRIRVVQLAERAPATNEGAYLLRDTRLFYCRL